MSKHFQHIHTTQIDSISGGDSAFISELSRIFLEQIPDFISNMSNFLKEEKWEQLAREAHTAKSSVLTFGMEETGSLLKHIQYEIKENNLILIPKRVEQTIEQLMAAVPELEELKNQN